MNNPGFNLTGFREVKEMSSETGFALSPKQWIRHKRFMTGLGQNAGILPTVQTTISEETGISQE